MKRTNWLYRSDVADILGISVDWFDKLVRKGDFPRPIKVNGKGRPRWRMETVMSTLKEA